MLRATLYRDYSVFDSVSVIVNKQIIGKELSNEYVVSKIINNQKIK